MLDLIFKNATVVDGSGNPSWQGDVGVKNGKIKLDMEGAQAKEIVDASGLFLCPGFVDSHSHGDRSIGTLHGTLSKISQGITTEIGGQCGYSAFPVDSRFVQDYADIMSTIPDIYQIPYQSFVDFKSFCDYVSNGDFTVNIAFLVGHNTLRASVMGTENRAPTQQEMELMKQRLKEAMENGAVGLSSGLIYIPGSYSEKDELIELCKVMLPYGGKYATHMRNESDEVVKSVAESIEIAKSAGVSLVISHHKVNGRSNWGASKQTLSLVEQAVAEGVDVMLDQYPYNACMTSLHICIPPEYFADGLESLVLKLKDSDFRQKLEGEICDPSSKFDNYHLNSGGFEGVFISSAPNAPQAEGMTVAEYAKVVEKRDFDAYFDLLIETEGAGNAIYFTIDENELEKIYLHPKTMVGTDGLCIAVDEKGHPRAFGSFVRTLTEFANKRKIISFEQAIRKQTSLTAQCWGIESKGLIAEGYDADILLIDREKLCDRASYKDSNLLSDGIEKVYIDGKIVYADKKLTGEQPGKILFKKN